MVVLLSAYSPFGRGEERGKTRGAEIDIEVEIRAPFGGRATQTKGLGSRSYMGMSAPSGTKVSSARRPPPAPAPRVTMREASMPRSLTM